MTLSMRMRPASSQRGLSLIEMMISISIGLFLLAGLVGIFVNSSQTSAELSKSAQQVENGRFAMQTLADDLTLAGYYGHYAPPAATAKPDPCAITAADLTAAVAPALRMPVQAYNAPATSPIPPCLPVANHVAFTDIMVVRRADTKETDTTLGNQFEIGRIYIQASPDPDAQPLIQAATTIAGPLTLFTLKKKDNSIAPVRKLHVHIYFISPCSQVCTGGAGDDAIPTLKRIELTSAGLQVVPIAEGIENLQFDYGLDADGDGAPETPFVEDPGTPANWTNVVALRVALLARNVESSPGYADGKTYNLGQFVSVTPTGAAAPFKRHAYTGLVRVVNTSARREQP